MLTKEVAWNQSQFEGGSVVVLSLKFSIILELANIRQLAERV